jgi:uncharacterized membrane protein
MSRFIGYFARGCLVLIPVAATVYVLWAVITAMDSLLGVSLPGLGLIVAIALTTLVGFLASNVIGRRVYGLFDHLMENVPFVKLFYTSIRDLLETFVGEKKQFGKPVSVRLSPGNESRVLGLLTREDLSALGLPDHVAVYLPQAYNIGGQVLAIHKDQVELISIPSSEMLTFMMSGGASGLGTNTKTPPAVA